ncbi:MAG TPA: IPT/TIG domain-containing protein [Bacteroidia bacterium]|nr:IPT/TIG domain-containing protein [Bacteroidia bacterium]
MKRTSIIYFLLPLFGCFLFSCSKKEDVKTCMECPVISSLSKTIGSVNDTITITGINFSESGNHVTFNGKEAKTSFESPTSIIAYVPANCGTGPVIVQRSDQLSSNEDKEFTEIYRFTVSTYAGMAGSPGWYDGAITYVFLRSPSVLSMDAENNLVICDEGNNCVRKISNGFIKTIAGRHDSVGFRNSPDGLSALFNGPCGLAINASNSVFISDHKNHSVRNYSPIGFVTQACGNPFKPGYADGNGEAASFNFPGRMLMLEDNTFLVVDSANYRIRKVNAKGDVTLFAGTGAPGGQNGNVLKASFYNPKGMVLYDAQTLLIADAGNAKIRKVNLSTGEVSDFAGYGKQGFLNADLSKSMFNNPAGIAVRNMNGKREIFIADTENNMIRMIDAQNNVTTVIGTLQPGSQNGEGTRAALNGPTDLVFDKKNNAILYIADRRNHTIRKVIIE